MTDFRSYENKKKCKKWYEANKEKKKAYQKAYYQKTKLKKAKELLELLA